MTLTVSYYSKSIMDIFNPDCPRLPWMVDFFSSPDGQVLNTQLSAAFAPNQLQHLSSLSLKSKPSPFKATQLMVTVPLEATCNTIEDMILQGVSIARIAMPASQIERMHEHIAKIRCIVDEVSRKLGRVYPLALAIDVKGAEIRTGILENDKKEVYLRKGKITTLTTDEAYEEFVSEDMIFVDYEKLPEIIQPGDKVLVDYGAVRLSAIQVAESIVRCIVEEAGKLACKSSIIVPNAPLDLVSISDDDKRVIGLATDLGLEFIILSGIHNKDNIADVKQLLGVDKIQIIAKIENSMAVDNIDSIIALADAICIDCQRLLLEIPKQKIFIVQKSIIAKCNLAGKPVICSVMCQSPLSKSDVGDVANVVIDGADALLIDQNCTKELLRDISNTCREAEPSVYQKQLFEELVFNIATPNEAIYSLCISAVEASMKTGAAALICLTTSGRTAKLLSRFRPRCPIITITRYPRIARYLRLYKNVDTIIYLRPQRSSYDKDVEDRVQLGITYGKFMGYIRMGDAVVSVSGSRPEVGFPNNLKIMYASDYDTVLSKARGC